METRVQFPYGLLNLNPCSFLLQGFFIFAPNQHSCMSASIRLLYGGEDFFQQLEQLIDLAQSELHLQTYRLAEDATGMRVAEALRNAAARGVKIYILLDAYGSGGLSKNFIVSLKEAGIQTRFFSPLFFFQGWFFGRRLHHKIALADDRLAIIGGINISDNYRGTESAPAWLDFAIWLEGSVCSQIQEICQELWGRKFLKTVKLLRRSKAPGQKVTERIKVIHNDWFRYKNQVDDRYRQAVQEAKSSILIVASYFLPGLRFRMALVKAAKNGISVRLVLAGRSDVPIVKHAGTHLYRFFLKNGIEIFEWHESVLHAKVMMIDGNWFTLGSFNLNYLSTYGSIETNVESTDSHTVRQLSKELDRVVKGCEKITLDQVQRKENSLVRVRNWFAYRLMRRAFLIMTFFTFKRWGKTTFKE